MMTSGNHIFDKRDIIPYIERNGRLLRPANYPPGTPGAGMWLGEVRGVRVAVLNFIGRVFMGTADDPFRVANELIESIPADVRVRLVDMHAEATSEKSAMGWFLDGRVSVVVGTHTHVQTADERILPNGTAYLTDLGMTGSYAGVIGIKEGDRRFTSVTPVAPNTPRARAYLRPVIELTQPDARAKFPASLCRTIVRRFFCLGSAGLAPSHRRQINPHSFDLVT